MATDTFTYSDGILETVSAGVWVESAGTISGVSSTEFTVSSGTTYADAGNAFAKNWFNTAATGQDQFSEITFIEDSPTGYYEQGVTTRGITANYSCYYAYVNATGGAELVEFTAGGISILDSASGLTVTGTHTLRLESIGSTHTVYLDDVEIMSASDSSLTGTYCGIGSYRESDGDTMAVTAWEGGDLVTSLILEPPAIASTATLFGGNVVPGAVTLSPPAIASTVLIHEPSIGAAAVVLEPPPITSTVSLLAPTLVPGAVTLSPPAIPATSQLRVPSLVSLRFATAISGRKIIDQLGGVYLMRSMSSWTITDLSDADITTALEGITARGFNAVTVWGGAGYRLDATYDDRYERKATSDAWWAGTPWASALGPAWTAMDHVADECLRLGLTLNFSFCGGNGATGARPDWEAATDADMQQVGVDVATRYPVASYPNIVWHVMFDDVLGGSTATRINALFAGIESVEGTDRPVRWAEPYNLTSVYDMLIDGDVIPNFGPSMNGFYDNGGSGSTTWMNQAQTVEASYNEAGATTLPTGNTEPYYDGSPLFGGVGDYGQQLREQSYACFLEGGVYINYSHEDWWPFGKNGWIGSTEGLEWDEVADHVHTIEQSYCWALIDEYVADATWEPDDGSFLTAGTASGDTKVACGRSETAALAYKPHALSLTIDLSVFFYPTARVRWFDPTDGTYSTVGTFATSSGSQVITHPGNNSALQPDWVLVVDRMPGLDVFPPTINSTVNLRTQTVTPGAVTLRPPAISSGASLLAPNVVPGAVTLTAPAISSTVALYALTVTGGAAVLEPPAIASTLVIYSPGVFNGLFPPLIVSELEIFTPVVALGFVPTSAVPFEVPRRTIIHIVHRPDDPVWTAGPYTHRPGV